MSIQNIPTNNVISFEDIKELFRETRGQFQEVREMFERTVLETDKRFLETDKQLKETDKQLKETDKQLKETDKQLKETDKQLKETDRQLKKMSRETNKKISKLGNRIGEIIEAMVEGNILKKFKELNYPFNQYASHVKFVNYSLDIKGEIDFLLENNDILLLVEVKTYLSISDVKEHLIRLEKYRRYLDARGDKRKLLAAVAGGVVNDHVRDFVLECGLFLLLQSGESIKIIKPPKDSDLKTW
jgi:hypothetical protein